jgi:hypothetical protein
MKICLDIHNLKLLNGCKIEFNPEIEDTSSLISSICECIFDRNAASFRISGCGDENWRIDTLFDLPTFIEQLPESLNMARSGENTINIDLYEQGVERQICFERKNDCYLINVVSNNNCISNKSEVIKTSDLVLIFKSLRNNFLRLSEEIELTDLARQEMQIFWLER